MDSDKKSDDWLWSSESEFSGCEDEQDESQNFWKNGYPENPSYLCLAGFRDVGMDRMNTD